MQMDNRASGTSMILFKHGDCRDACVGTLLASAGFSHPECILFKDMAFTLKHTEDPYRALELSYRNRDYAEDLEELLGVTFSFEKFKEISAFCERVYVLLEEGERLVIVVDHFEYEHSQFYQSGHMPHYVILEGYHQHGSSYRYLDPFPFCDAQGEVSRDRLQRWCDSPSLPEFRLRFFRAIMPSDLRFDGVAWLREGWRQVIEQNLEQMLSPGSDAEHYRGIDAIFRVAAYLEDWVRQGDFMLPDGRRRKFPINSFLDVGGNRAGHGRWLSRLAEVIGSPLIQEISAEFQLIAAYWNTVGSIRHLYQEQRMATAHQVSEAFLMKKLRRVPDLLHEIAKAEEKALRRLSTVL